VSGKPWLGNVKAPTNERDLLAAAGVGGGNEQEPPAVQLRKAWVHGYAVTHARANLWYGAPVAAARGGGAGGGAGAGEWAEAPEGKEDEFEDEDEDEDEGGGGGSTRRSILYHTAGLGVVYDRASHSQRLFDEHDDDVTCLAASPCGCFVATGQLGAAPAIWVWSAEDAQPLIRLRGFHARAVLLLAFSADGTALASVGDDDNHSVAVYAAQVRAPPRIASAAPPPRAVQPLTAARGPVGGGASQPLTTAGAGGAGERVGAGAARSERQGRQGRDPLRLLPPTAGRRGPRGAGDRRPAAHAILEA
jgi:hypothetical protein